MGQLLLLFCNSLYRLAPSYITETVTPQTICSSYGQTFSTHTNCMLLAYSPGRGFDKTSSVQYRFCNLCNNPISLLAAILKELNIP